MIILKKLQIAGLLILLFVIILLIKQNREAANRFNQLVKTAHQLDDIGKRCTTQYSESVAQYSECANTLKMCVDTLKEDERELKK